ncbi:HI0074 family nucleotidyltransferase substrate-binding subunit [Helicobacter fennelliae]|uniref:Nucleotidyltransferase substrate binding protein, HI0074 family n=1 Tax=Helicobacter fennelliae MRY12-0050 TaxID=1325130 RepID=T1DWH6_9HELI|nr:HI0074 family nucleotidyltransferase substrate-binding subunit [Helicobacter fennelliae]GAD19648.1 nucleotidyltransferase substrate binding protein, HI0074 family [Helicobacter fennelliae MRY12-0050]STP07938.1 nucleotidyltransferase substrate binding protein, HI0074 family [Helicobacter fennelliae]
MFDKAFLNLDELKARDFSSFSTLEKEGIIQRFEILVELSWKVLKDFLENEGFLIASPKDAIRQAFSSKLFGVDIADKWLESLNIRNLTSHTYTQDALDKNVRFILDEFLPLVKNLQQILKGKLCDMG